MKARKPTRPTVYDALATDRVGDTQGEGVYRIVRKKLSRARVGEFPNARMLSFRLHGRNIAQNEHGPGVIFFACEREDQDFPGAV
jgi:hypothetical protein